MNPSVHIGELHLPGSGRPLSARTFVLTIPAGNEADAVEVLFGMFVADVPKRAIEKLCDRVTEDVRGAFFQRGLETEARFEASLKEINRVILNFLHEHGLSLPGIALRGAVGALIGRRLLVASRGRLRGTLVMPQGGNRTAYKLFEDAPSAQTSPKFFTTFQDGQLAPGSRLYVSTDELFEALDETHANRLFTDPDAARTTREFRQALKSAAASISIMSLSLPTDAPAEAATVKASAAPAAKKPVRVEKAAPARPPMPVGPDVGELVSRGIKRLLGVIWNGLKALPGLFLAGGKLLLAGLRRLSAVPQLVREPSRIVDSAFDRLNAVPAGRRMHFLLMFLVVNIAAHGVIFSVKRQAVIGEVRAYEARLAGFHQLQTDLETSMIYGNDVRTAELLAQMEAAVAALPADDERQRATRDEASTAIEAAKSRLRKETRVSPESFARFTDPSGVFKGAAMAPWKGGIYLFSPDTASVMLIGADGTAAPAEALAGLPGGIADAVPASTGFMLSTVDGSVWHWNPDTGAVTPYGRTVLERPAPLLYYQNRLYSTATGTMIVRRQVQDKKLGPASTALDSFDDAKTVTGVAADGALYVLTSDGEIRKTLKGAPVEAFKPAPIEPKPKDAGALWVSPDSGRLILLYVEKGGDRAYVIDKNSGKLAMQIVLEKEAGLSAAFVEGGMLYLLVDRGVLRMPF
jgi:hypothetical protein